MLHYQILPEAQQRLLAELGVLSQHGFVLYGETSIALQLGHRISIDFDFFSSRQIARDRLLQLLPLLAQGRTVQDEENTLSLKTEEGVYLSFFGGIALGRLWKACGGYKAWDTAGLSGGFAGPEAGNHHSKSAMEGLLRYCCSLARRPEPRGRACQSSGPVLAFAPRKAIVSAQLYDTSQDVAMNEDLSPAP